VVVLLTNKERNMSKETINDGGPAFPVPPPAAILNGYYYYAEVGMSLRDYFAAQALAGVLQNYTTSKFGCTEKEVAIYAYRYADAMLAERAKRKEAAS
jgi:hypothetical protein